MTELTAKQQRNLDATIAAVQRIAMRIVTLPIPVDSQFFRPRSEPAEDGSGVLTVGKDLARDYGTFLDAVRPLAVDATVVAHPRNLEGQELPPNAAVRSGLSFTELRELYARAACVVLPQRREEYVYGSEGGGLTALLEAMAMGRPIVASNRAILHDYVSDGAEASVNGAPFLRRVFWSRRYA